MNCINCGKETQDNYCSSCGQRMTVKRITFKEGWTDFWSRVYGFDGMLPSTLKDLTLRPGQVARQYIKGNRIRYYGPVGYFFMMITIFLLLMNMMDISVFSMINEKREMVPLAGKPEGGQSKLVLMALDFISRNMKVIAFLNVPFHAFSARYFMFRLSGLNFMENMVMPFYLMGHLYWLSIASAVVFFYTQSFILTTGIGIVSLIYYGYAYAGFIEYQPKWKSFLKGIGVYVGGQAALMVVASVLAIIVIIILYYTDREVFEMIRPSNNR